MVIEYGLYATTLWRTATVVWKWSNIYDFHNLDTCTMNGADCRLTAITWTFDVCLHLAETEVVGNLCTILSCHLSGIGSVLL